MNASRSRITRDERGASLVLAIVFMVIAGAIGAALTTTVTTGVSDSGIIANARNREYAADGGIETAVAAIRALPNPGANAQDCPAGGYTSTLNSVHIRVDCTNTPSVAVTATGTLVAQNNVTFRACVNPTPSVACTTAAAIITAQVNYQGTGTQTSTFVEAWSVNA